VQGDGSIGALVLTPETPRRRRDGFDLPGRSEDHRQKTIADQDIEIALTDIGARLLYRGQPVCAVI